MNAARTFLETGQEVMGVATLTQIITEAEQANDKECLIAAYRLRGTALLKMGDKAGAEAGGKARHGAALRGAGRGGGAARPRPRTGTSQRRI